MKELTAAGKTSVVSSHILPELSEICTSIGILERGKLVVSGKVAEIAAGLQGPREVEVEVAGDAAAVGGVLRGRPGVDEVRSEGARARVVYSGTREALPDLLRALVQAGVPVLAFAERRTSLEEVFLKVAAFEVG
jgi:ABC-2 type transport system ATP-binding protein